MSVVPVNPFAEHLQEGKAGFVQGELKDFLLTKPTKGSNESRKATKLLDKVVGSSSIAPKNLVT